MTAVPIRGIEDTVPNSPETEQAILGCILFAPKTIKEASGLLTGQDFYQPNHEALWLAMQEMDATGSPLTAVSVSEHLLKTGKATLARYLPELLSVACTVPQLEYHAGVLRDYTARRKGIDAAVSALQQFRESADPVDTILERVTTSFRQVPGSRDDMDDLDPMTLREFVNQPIPPNDWIIKGLLDREDRFVLTGVEGMGKTVLMRQIAVCVAKGVHPFTWQESEPRTVLYVDAENPPKIMQKSFGQILTQMEDHRGPVEEARAWVKRRPQGMHLGNPADRLWLTRLVEMVNPDLLCIGPAYKLCHASGRERDEDLARMVTSALDEIREACGCAIILEHHSPHGEQGKRDVRPIGSSMWLRWPEFGMGIRPADGFTNLNRLCDLVPWRGSRDERDWPKQLSASGDFMPWMDAQYT
jgi:replicative DNA helicase